MPMTAINCMVLRPQFNRLQFLLSLKLDIKGGDRITVLEAGLPNAQGEYSSIAQGGACTYTGALRGVKSETDIWPAADKTLTSRCWEKIYLDLSKSNAIYGKTNTVQPPAISLIPQIRY